MIFHLANFPDYIGDPVVEGTAVWLGRTTFRAQGWLVELDWVRQYSELKAELRANHGYALTHIGRLARADGTLFTAARGVRFVESLHSLFGFIRGGWCGPALLIGQDKLGGRTWEQWSVRLVSPAVYRHSFFVDTDPAMIGRLAPGFLAKISSDRWGEPFRRAVGFYVAANRAVPIEIGIVLAHSALELLSWSVFVRSGRVAPSAFEGWNAARRIRNLMERARTPMTVPATLSELARLTADLSGGSDVADALAYVRNRIVHPPRNKKLTPLGSPLLQDAWRLSLLFAELSLLRLAGYRGDIWSRVEEATVPAPW